MQRLLVKNVYDICSDCSVSSYLCTYPYICPICSLNDQVSMYLVIQQYLAQIIDD